MSDIFGAGQNVVYFPNRNAAREVLGLSAPLVQKAGEAAFLRASRNSSVAAGSGDTIQLTDLTYTKGSNPKGGRPRIRVMGLYRSPAHQRRVEMAVLLGLTASI